LLKFRQLLSTTEQSAPINFGPWPAGTAVYICGTAVYIRCGGALNGTATEI
jgi:hypothetical protein